MFTPYLAMHIPDGFLTIPVSMVGWILSVIFVHIALRHTRTQFEDQQIPLLGILAAFVFAAQMINFPIAGGTSGHLIGGTLVAVILGPWAATLVMSSVVIVQALVFADGGLVVLGCNLFNMAVVSPFIGYGVFVGLRDMTKRDSMLWIAIGAITSVEVSALATSIELSASGTSPLNIVLPTMLGVHALIGMGEGLITASAIIAIKQVRGDLMETQPQQSIDSRWVAIGLFIAIVIVLLSPLASPYPDGLEYVAEDHGFIDLGKEPTYNFLTDYRVPFIENEAVSTIGAGILGILIVVGATHMISRKRREEVVSSEISY